jgi:hypothetical protein
MIDDLFVVEKQLAGTVFSQMPLKFEHVDIDVDYGFVLVCVNVL